MDSWGTIARNVGRWCHFLFLHIDQRKRKKPTQDKRWPKAREFTTNKQDECKAEAQMTMTSKAITPCTALIGSTHKSKGAVSKAETFGKKAQCIFSRGHDQMITSLTMGRLVFFLRKQQKQHHSGGMAKQQYTLRKNQNHVCCPQTQPQINCPIHKSWWVLGIISFGEFL